MLKFKHVLKSSSQGLVCKRHWSWRSSVAEARVMNSCEKNEHTLFLFPWREKPEESRVYSYFQSCAFRFIRSIFLGKHFFSDDDIVNGAHTAFRVTLDGIFKHRLITNRANNSISVTDKDANENEFQSSTKNLDVPELKDILETKLAAFYENAILKFSISNNCDISYTLLDSATPRIVSREMILGVNRDGPNIVKNPLYLPNPFGVCFVVDKSLVQDENGQLSFEKMKEVTNGTMLSGELCMRFWVDVECHEIFFVRDKLTETVVQGSTNPQAVTHQILLETNMRYRVQDLPLQQMGDCEWNVVDLDFWMCDSHFWAHKAKQDGK